MLTIIKLVATPKIHRNTSSSQADKRKQDLRGKGYDEPAGGWLAHPLHSSFTCTMYSYHVYADYGRSLTAGSVRVKFFEYFFLFYFPSHSSVVSLVIINCYTALHAISFTPRPILFPFHRKRCIAPCCMKFFFVARASNRATIVQPYVCVSRLHGASSLSVSCWLQVYQLDSQQST